MAACPRIRPMDAYELIIEAGKKDWRIRDFFEPVQARTPKAPTRNEMNAMSNISTDVLARILT